MNLELREAIQKSIGARMKHIRKEKGLKQNEVARRCGFYKSNYNSIELGLRNVSLINIYKIAFVLETPISNFFENDDFFKFLKEFKSIGKNQEPK